MMIIFIIGPGGAGKTTSGKFLAKKLKYDFFDLDEKFTQLIEEIGKYINDFGLEKYHQKNFELFYSLLKKINTNTVFVLSSGFFVHEELENLQLKNKLTLEKYGKIIMLLPSSSLDECVSIIVQRQLKRGFGLNAEREKQKIIFRFSIYRKKGDIKIFSSDDPEHIAEKMKEELFKRFASLKELN